MRPLLLALALACVACGPPRDSGCEQDNDCIADTDVCARNGECMPPSDVRAVRITWTIRGAAASDATCSPSPDLYINFIGNLRTDTFGYDPVPCDAGLFNIDKLPTRFLSVEIGEHGGFVMEKSIPVGGNVSFDLMP